MNIQIPDHISTLRSYHPGKAISQLKAEFGWKQMAILWNNENTLGYSLLSQGAVMEAYEKINYYPDAHSADLKRRLALRLGRESSEIVLGNGSESILMLVIRAMYSGEDEFLTSEGSFLSIYNWTKVNNVRCMSMPMEEDYAFDLEAIKSRINRSTKIIYLANVNNPTATMISKADLKDFMESIPDHILVIVDEAYFEFSEALSGDYPNSLTLGFPNVLTLRTFSKAYGIAGVRLGYGIGHPQVIEAIAKTKLTFEPSSLAQAAGIGALQDEVFLDKTIANNIAGFNFFYKEFDRLGMKYVPSFGNFVITVWESVEQVNEVFNKLMKKGVLGRPLAGNLKHCIRISVGRPDENAWLVENLVAILDVKEE